jgi:hypothetical protein
MLTLATYKLKNYENSKSFNNLLYNTNFDIFWNIYRSPTEGFYFNPSQPSRSHGTLAARMGYEKYIVAKECKINHVQFVEITDGIDDGVICHHTGVIEHNIHHLYGESSKTSVKQGIKAFNIKITLFLALARCYLARSSQCNNGLSVLSN